MKNNLKLKKELLSFTSYLILYHWFKVAYQAARDDYYLAREVLTDYVPKNKWVDYES